MVTFVLTFAILGVIAFGLFFYFSHREYEGPAAWMMGLFWLCGCIGLLGGFLKLYTVRCPECGGRTRTIQNRRIDMWQAHCARCAIAWNLGVGIDTG